MRSFLLKNNHPTIKWSLQKSNTFYEGKVPDGFSLAIVPEEYVVLDIDVKNGKNGFNHIPMKIQEELDRTFYYNTKSGGRHYWILYLGDKQLMNRATSVGLDLRVSDRGYVKYNWSEDIRECVTSIRESSPELNSWLEELFA